MQQNRIKPNKQTNRTKLISCHQKWRAAMTGKTTNIRRPVLVFLPAHPATTIVAKLERVGFPAVAVSTVPDLFDALRSEAFSLVITTRPDIDIVRNIEAIPVVNLEVFFHSAMAANQEHTPGKMFDNNAFMRRIERLSTSRSPRNDDPEATGTTTRQSLGFWKATRNLLGRRMLTSVGG